METPRKMCEICSINNKDTRTTSMTYFLFWCFNNCFWTNKCRLGKYHFRRMTNFWLSFWQMFDSFWSDFDYIWLESFFKNWHQELLVELAENKNMWYPINPFHLLPTSGSKGPKWIKLLDSLINDITAGIDGSFWVLALV